MVRSSPSSADDARGDSEREAMPMRREERESRRVMIEAEVSVVAVVVIDFEDDGVEASDVALISGGREFWWTVPVDDDNPRWCCRWKAS